MDHLVLRNPAADREIWLDASARALPLQVAVVAPTTGRPLRITDDVPRRNLELPLPDCTFAFVAPSGARDATLPAPHRARTGD